MLAGPSPSMSEEATLSGHTEAIRLPFIEWDTLSMAFPGDSFLLLPVSKSCNQIPGAEGSFSTGVNS
jgi:hypothetical protein